MVQELFVREIAVCAYWINYVITRSIPQGPILSPLLLCIYINNLQSTIRSNNLDSYVDDSKLYQTFSINDMEQTSINLQEDLHRDSKWYVKHQLLINRDKTKFLIVGSKPMLQNSPTEMTLNFLGKIIKPVWSAKDLVLNFDSYLSYDDHTSKLVSSCMSKLCRINRVKDSLDNETILLVNKALVINKLLYCATVWFNTSSKNIKKLQAIQNVACSIITHTRKFDHVTPTLRELNWLPIEQLLSYRDTLMASKCFNDLAPNYFVNKFTKGLDIHNCATRNHHLLDIPFYKTSSRQRTFDDRAVKIWNYLDGNLKNVTTLSTFNRKLKEQFLRKFYGTL